MSASRLTGTLVALVLLAGCGAGAGAGARTVARSGPEAVTVASPARAAVAQRRSRLSLIAEPEVGARPFLALIGGARHRIELTMYELSDRVVERALASAAVRGVDVRVALNGGYYSERDAYNAPARAYLSAHRVHVRYTPTYFALTHEKTLTVDGRVSAIMTLNFDGLYASTRDYAILDRRAADVRAIVAAFDDDWAGRLDSPSRGSGDLVWSPGAEGDVLGLIDHARRTIELEDEEMAYEPATDALCGAARRGVRVRIVMTYESDWRAALARLRRCGAWVRVYHGQSYYIHAKALVADGRVALVGSQNLSAGSLGANRELGITVGDRAIVSALARDIARDYAGAQPGLGAAAVGGGRPRPHAPPHD
jgi:phosphatidylserine/phosphatidylglycerophosphate/cardiolipin synthase-like enzyme